MAVPRLEVRDVLGERVVPLDRMPFTIGRRETNDLRLGGSEVSREHAEIVSRERPVRPARPRVALRHVRQRRAGHRVRARARRPHPPRPRRRRRAGVPARPTTIRSVDAADRRPALATTCGRSRRCSKASARSAPAACSQEVLALVLDAAIEVTGAERGVHHARRRRQRRSSSSWRAAATSRR